jgi:hypothetical protein
MEGVREGGREGRRENVPRVSSGHTSESGTMKD